MGNFVISYFYSDWDYSSEYSECIQYESLEKLKFDLELFIEECRQNKTGSWNFNAVELNMFALSHNLPEVQELNDWFMSKLESNGV